MAKHFSLPPSGLVFMNRQSCILCGWDTLGSINCKTNSGQSPSALESLLMITLVLDGRTVVSKMFSRAGRMTQHLRKVKADMVTNGHMLRTLNACTQNNSAGERVERGPDRFEMIARRTALSELETIAQRTALGELEVQTAGVNTCT